MIRALYSAASGMAAQQTRTDVIANNLANVNTIGYKASRTEFADLLYETLDGNQGPLNTQVGHGAQVTATLRVHTPGAMTKTDDPMHVALQGRGFLRVSRGEAGEAYTREGSLSLDGQGYLTTAGGQQVLSEEGTPLQIPLTATDVRISPEGVVSYLDPASQERVEVGRLGLARFTNPSGLLALGGNLYEATQASGDPVYGRPGEEGMTILPGYLENSNVEVVTEMVNLITAQRTYELNSRALQSADEMMAMVNRLRR